MAWLLVPASYAASALEITHIAATPGGVQLEWSVPGTGVVYTVQSREIAGDGIWLMPQDQLWPVSLPNWLDQRPASPQVRFYRVAAVPVSQRGRVLSVSLVRTMTAGQINLYFFLGGIPLTAQYDVRMYKVGYETITPLGGRTTASGALLLPLNTGKLLPLVSYQHGTIAETNAAPSSMNVTGEAGVGLALACTGYAAALPDYLGLGSSPGLHPFQHARSEASASIDMLRAVRTLCATNGFALTNKLFLTGYSQGGHATMALLREIETFHSNEFNVTACAPMAGAYDLSGVTATDVLSGRSQPNPYYFAYLLASYQSVYHFAPTLADLLAPPYNTTLPPLLQGNSSGATINAAMPADPALILKPEILTALRTNMNHPLRVALRDNDVYAWRPRAPMRLYHCAGDQDVIIANSQVALTSFQNRGATQVQLIDPQPSAGHGDCAMPAMLQGKAWFDTLR